MAQLPKGITAGYNHLFQAKEGVGSAYTLLLLHDETGDETSLMPMARTLLPGAAILSLRGKVLEQGAPRFFRHIAEGVFDQQDLSFRTEEVALFLRRAASEYGFRLESLIPIGYGNGAVLVASLLLRNPGLVQLAVLLHAGLPFLPSPLPDLGGTSVLITAGELDPQMKASDASELADLFNSCGAEAELFLTPGGHELAEDEVNEAREYLEDMTA